LGKTSPIEVVVKETGVGTRVVNIEVKTTGIKPIGAYKIFAAIAEKTRNQATPNGEKVHYDVFRKFLTASSGDAITFAENGSSANLSFNYNVVSPWVEAETYVLVWVQDVNTKEVLNSGSKFDVITGNSDLSSSDIKILSNPVRTELVIQLSKPLEGSYYIMNIMGQIIEKGNLNQLETKFELPVSNYKSGMYFVRIESNGQKITKRWIKESFNP
ncbi:MAG: T9SS type A sorting domain-containing protein, partial [Saprospiraceae bacterium]